MRGGAEIDILLYTGSMGGEGGYFCTEFGIVHVGMYA